MKPAWALLEAIKRMLVNLTPTEISDFDLTKYDRL